MGELPGRFTGGRWPSVAGALRFNVCSSSPQRLGGHPVKQLSPFFLGPIELDLPAADGDPGGTGRRVVKNLENLWQASKVWPGESTGVGPKCRPTAEWFRRRFLYWKDPAAHRRIKRGTGPNSNVPPFCWWLGARLDYVEARCRVYIPIYADLAARTPAFAALRALVGSGKDVLLVGYDGYAIDKPLIDYLLDKEVCFGHELVLAAMLRGEEPWRAAYPDIQRVWRVPDTLVPDTQKRKSTLPPSVLRPGKRKKPALERS